MAKSRTQRYYDTGSTVKGKSNKKKAKKAKKKKAKYDKKYNARPKQKKRRAARNQARKKMVMKHGKEALKGKDVDHSDKNPHNNKESNLKVMSKSKNRGRK